VNEEALRHTAAARCFQNNIVSLHSGWQIKRTSKIRENTSPFFFITLRVKFIFVEDLRLMKSNNRQLEASIATNTV
jgi:hypothetical protein